MKQLTATQWAEWEAYLSIDPINERKQDYRMSFLYSLLTNLVIRALGSKGAKLTTVEDFVLDWDAEYTNKLKNEEKKITAPKRIFEIFSAIAEAQNKKEITNK